MSECAYCKKNKTLTREHIIPSFLYSFVGQSGGVTGWSDRAVKMINAEQKIKDVCSSCNNEKLGLLDKYASNFLYDNKIMTRCFPNKKILIQYDYDSLLRWLLKVSFNSARASKGNDCSILDVYTSYILGEELPEGDKGIFLIAELLKPVHKSNNALKYLSEEFKEDEVYFKNGLINPFMFNNRRLLSTDSAYIGRVVRIGALVFYIIIFIEDMKLGYKKARLRKLIKHLGVMYLIKKEKNIQLIESGDRTFLDIEYESFKRTSDEGMFSTSIMNPDYKKY